MAKTVSRPETDAAEDVAEPPFDYSEFEVLLEAEDGMPPVYTVTPEQGRRLFDEAVQQMIGISGEEFIRRWEAGEYWGIADEPGRRHIGYLIGLIPLARIES